MTELDVSIPFADYKTDVKAANDEEYNYLMTNLFSIFRTKQKFPVKNKQQLYCEVELKELPSLQ